MTLHPDTASKYGGLAVIGLIAGGVFAVGAMIVPLPKPEVEEPEVDLRVRGEAGADANEDESRSFETTHTDWSSLAERVAWMSPEVVEQEEEPSADEKEQLAAGEEGPEEEQGSGGPQVVQQGPPGWKYLGYLGADESLSALVAVSGVQRVVREGDEIDEYVIEGISRDAMQIARNDVEHELQIESRPTVALGDGGGARGAAAPNRRGSSVNREDRLSEIERRRQERLERLRQQRSGEDERSGRRNPR